MTPKVISASPVQFCPLCAAKLKKSVIQDRYRLKCPSCNWIHYRNPVPAAACLVLNSKKEVLMVKRGVQPQKGKWSLPAGFIEIDESPEQAALRELEEESGIKGEVIRLIGAYLQPSSNYGAVLTVGFFIKKMGGRLKAGDDALEAKFRKIEDISKIPFVSHRKMLKKELG